MTRTLFLLTRDEDHHFTSPGNGLSLNGQLPKNWPERTDVNLLDTTSAAHISLLCKLIFTEYTLQQWWTHHHRLHHLYSVDCKLWSLPEIMYSDYHIIFYWIGIWMWNLILGMNHLEMITPSKCQIYCWPRITGWNSGPRTAGLTRWYEPSQYWMRQYLLYKYENMRHSWVWPHMPFSAILVFCK